MSEHDDEAVEPEETDEVDDDEPEAMTGSAVLSEPSEDDFDDDEPDDEPQSTAGRPGYPITIDLDAQGNGSTHLGVFQQDIAAADIDGVAPECVYVSDHPSAVGIAVIEVRGASTRSKPVNGFVVLK